MKSKNPPALLIDPAEICELSKRAGTIDDTERGAAVAREFLKRCDKRVFYIADTWLFNVMLGTVFTAGRIQGYREQRQKMKRREGTRQ